MTIIEAIKADITTLQVDAIVNAANERMRGGGGVDGAIHRAAGFELLQSLMQYEGCEVGDLKVTPGFKLPSKFVFHAVGPIWHGGDAGEPGLLASCYSKSIVEAHRLGLESIAFSAISTGVYGYPPALAAAVAVAAIRESLAAVGSDTTLQLVQLVAFSDDDLALLRAALAV
jgi:O-acetyl-ADP-ribose deacetylase